MIVLGVVLLVVGYLVGLGVLETLGLVLLLIGVVLMLLDTAGPVGGRWW